MEKVGKPKGLIRYTSLSELEFKQEPKPLYKRPRVIVYSSILVAALSVLYYGMSTLAPLDLKVLHDRQPLFVQLSDGSIRNKYELKIMNKTEQDMQVSISFESPIKGLKSKNELDLVTIPTGNVKSVFVYLSAFENNVGGNHEVTFVVKGAKSTLEYETSFFTPRSMR
jgi:polyferredoxin